MADNETEDSAAVAQDGAAAPKSKFKLIVIAVAVLVLASGAGTWFFFFRSHGEDAHAEAAKEAPKPPQFVDVPDMMVNLAGNPGERVQYLKVKVALEVKDEKQVEAIKPAMPRITDIFQTYLRELRANDINGSIGMFRLKEELTRRVNVVVAPTQVTAVLFKEIVVQ